MSEDELAQLRSEIRALGRRVEHLEEELHQLRQPIPEDDIFLLAGTTGATPVTGDIEIMQFFKNQITTDGDVSGLTPYKTIHGNAATVMADSWYQGGTAT